MKGLWGVVLETCTARRGQGSMMGRGKTGGTTNQLPQWAVTSSVVTILDIFFSSDTDDDRAICYLFLQSLRQLPGSHTYCASTVKSQMGGVRGTRGGEEKHM